MVSKLRPSLKALIARAADPLPGPPKSQLVPLFQKYDGQVTARSDQISRPAWITLASATFYTMNSPASLVHLWSYIQDRNPSLQEKVSDAILLREIGLKCIGFIGIAKIINELGVLHSAFDEETKGALPTTPSRDVNAENLATWRKNGIELWTDIYKPFETKLLTKLGSYHPDLPVHIIQSHYGPLFSDPTPENHPVGRVLTSLVAIASLRAQEGVGPQVTSHVFGLKKAQDAGWLGTDDGCEWALNVVDELTSTVKLANAQPRAKL